MHLSSNSQGKRKRCYKPETHCYRLLYLSAFTSVFVQVALLLFKFSLSCHKLLTIFQSSDKVDLTVFARYFGVSREWTGLSRFSFYQFVDITPKQFCNLPIIAAILLSQVCTIMVPVVKLQTFTWQSLWRSSQQDGAQSPSFCASYGFALSPVYTWSSPLNPSPAFLSGVQLCLLQVNWYSCFLSPCRQQSLQFWGQG